MELNTTFRKNKEPKINKKSYKSLKMVIIFSSINY